MIRAPALALALALAPIAAAADDPVAEPDGYRMEAFRAPVPETLLDAHVLGDAAAAAEWEAGALFIDVLPRPPKPAALPEGTVWREPARHSIPGAHWLPNVGFGRLDAARDSYFRGALDRLTEGDAARRLVFFCLADCWMSWNAARRAKLEYGYGNVAWYPDGTDGWAAAGKPLEEAAPEPNPAATEAVAE